MAAEVSSMEQAFLAVADELHEKRRRSMGPRRDGYVLPDDLYSMVQDIDRIQTMQMLSSLLSPTSFAPMQDAGRKELRELDAALSRLERAITFQIRARYS